MLYSEGVCLLRGYNLAGDAVELLLCDLMKRDFFYRGVELGGVFCVCVGMPLMAQQQNEAVAAPAAAVEGVAVEGAAEAEVADAVAGETGEVSVDELRKLAEQGNTDAQVGLGGACLLGLGTEVSLSEALRWIQPAAEKGNTEAQVFLGDMYSFGLGVPASLEKAAQWYLRAAQRGNAHAQAGMGLFASYGVGGVPQSFSEAAKWFSLSAGGGDDTGQMNLGLLYEFGVGVPQSRALAQKWLTKAKKQGNELAQYLLAEQVRADDAVETQNPDSFRWLFCAGKLDDAEALYCFALCCEGGLPGSPALAGTNSPSLVYEAMERAAELGYAKAQFAMGLYCLSGYGCERSLEKAAEWFQKAAEDGLPLAQLQLADMYFQGIGVEKSDEKAMAWLLQAAELGSGNALTQVACCYLWGLGVKASREQAVSYLKKATEMLQEPAALYMEGMGYKEEALHAYRWGAELGMPWAQYRLGGACLMNGKEAEGIRWMMRSAAQGYEDAVEFAESFREQCLQQQSESGNGTESGKEAQKAAGEAGSGLPGGGGFGVGLPH